VSNTQPKSHLQPEKRHFLRVIWISFARKLMSKSKDSAYLGFVQDTSSSSINRREFWIMLHFPVLRVKLLPSWYARSNFLALFADKIPKGTIWCWQVIHSSTSCCTAHECRAICPLPKRRYYVVQWKASVTRRYRHGFVCGTRRRLPFTCSDCKYTIMSYKARRH
jgi:hypothetical protein